MATEVNIWCYVWQR